VYTSVVSTTPDTLFGGTWLAIGAGRVLVGIDSNDTDFDTVEGTGGAKTHTLNVSEIPAHSHDVLYQELDNLGLTTHPAGTNPGDPTRTIATQDTGGGGAHNNLQPYMVVYMWKRVA
jgi:microcystin-dependent protein